MRRIVVAITLLLVAAGAAAGGLYWWRVLRFVETTDDAYLQSDVSVISPKVEGYVRAVPAQNNQAVKAGDVLVVLEDRDFAAKLATAEAAANAEAALLVTIDSQRSLQASLIDQAAANLTSAEAEQRRAQLDLRRYQSLAIGDVASRQKLETAEADARKAEAAVAGTRAALAAARGQLAVLEAQRKQQEAKLHQAEAQRDLARNDLDNTVIRAPVDGVVGNKGVQLGQYVKTGTQLLAVVPLPEIYVVANFKETQLRRMMPGQRAEVTIDAFPDAPIEGRIESVSPGSGSQWSILPPDNATGNFTKIVQRVPVRIALPSGNFLASRLRPGLSVTVAVTTSEAAKGEAMTGGAIWGALRPQQASLR